MLDQELLKAVEWLNESNQLIDGVSFSTTNRSRVSVGLLHLSLEHQQGIIALGDHGIFGSALALFRPQFEAYVRGVWFHWCASDNQIETFLGGGEPPKIGSLIKSVEQLDGYEGNALSKVKSEVWRTLNDYTHGGAIQVKARNNKDEIAYNYNPDHLAGVIQGSVGLAYSASVAIARIADEPTLATELMGLHQRIYAYAA
ncbi:DUF6988 family protein [Thiobacillus sp.]